MARRPRARGVPGRDDGDRSDAANSGASALRSAISRCVVIVAFSPRPIVRRTVEALLAGKAAKRGYLGVTAQPAPLPEALRDRLGQESGLLLTHIESKSPAEKSRLIQGDMLVTLNGQPVRSLADLQAVLTGERASERVAAKVVRGGAVRDLDVTIGERG